MIREWMPQSLTGRQVSSVDEAKRETEGIVSVVSANGKQSGGPRPGLYWSKSSPRNLCLKINRLGYQESRQK